MLAHRLYVVRGPGHRPGEWDEYFSLAAVEGDTNRMV